MKKILLFSLIVFLTSSLTACNRDQTYEDYQEIEDYEKLEDYPEIEECQDTIIESYLELEEQFFDLQYEKEYTIISETMFELHGFDDAILYYVSERTHVDGWSEAKEEVTIQNQDRETIMEYENIKIDGKSYTDIYSFTFSLLDFLYTQEGFVQEEIEQALSNTENQEDILGDMYSHVENVGPMLDVLQEAIDYRFYLWGIYNSFCDRTLERYLSRSERGVYRIEINGEAVRGYHEFLLEELHLHAYRHLLLAFRLVSQVDDFVLEQINDNLLGWLSDADFTDAHLVIEREKRDDYTFHRNMELVIPDLLSVTRQERIVVGRSTPVTAPVQTLTTDDAIDLVVSWAEEVSGIEPEEEDLGSILGLGEDDFIFHNVGNLDEELFGSWLWNRDDDYEYVFEDDGTGTRGFSDDIDSFVWWNESEGELVMIFDVWDIELWEYAIEDDVLTLSSLQIDDFAFSYIRN